MTSSRKKRPSAQLVAAVALAVFALLASPWWFAQRDRRRADAAALKALELYRAGDRPAAEAAIDRGLTDHRWKAPFRIASARILFDEGRFEDAAREALEAAKLSRSADGYALAGRSYSKLGQVLKANDAFGWALKLSPRSAGLHLEKAETELRLVLLNDASASASKALELGLPTAEELRAYRLRGKTKLAAGDLAGGLQDLDKAVELDEDDVLSRLLRAQTRYQLARFEGVVEDADTVLKLDGRNGPAYVLRAEGRLGLGKRREALSDLREAQKHLPGHPRIASLMRQLGRVR